MIHLRKSHFDASPTIFTLTFIKYFLDLYVIVVVLVR